MITNSKTGRIATLPMLLSLSLVYCKTSRKATASAPEEKVSAVSYTADILPIMERSCTPCHFPETGKKKLLNTYEATKENIVDIVNRIQLPAEEIKFMPFKSKKTPLSAEEIKLFKDWYNQGMAN